MFLSVLSVLNIKILLQFTYYVPPLKVGSTKTIWMDKH